MRDVLISVNELRDVFDSMTVLDVRWALGAPDGRQSYREGHLPGAVYVDLETELAAPPVSLLGRHPLPAIADLQAAARRWGVRRGVPVVVYDNSGGLAAARAWWLLRWAGLSEVRLLDGGLRSWLAAGLPVSSGDELPASPGDVELTAGNLPTLTADQAAELPLSGTLLDARAAERFRGDVEPVASQAGHIPGAVSAPTTENLDEDGRFRSASELRGRFEALGAGDRVGVYCGSGVTAAHEILALTLAGFAPSLYAESWSGWSSDPLRPVSTGA